MTTGQLLQRRLQSQRLATTTFTDPADVVRWHGAVQAQDYLGALWAVGLRSRGATEQSVEQALASRAFVRTWPMRGTLHFVAVADVRWMLALLASRVAAATAPMLARRFGLDARVVGRAGEIAGRALEGGRRLTRDGLYREWDRARISSRGRGPHLLCRLAQDGVLCFGLREGKQQTFVLLDDWVPAAPPLARDEALARLARRYLASHGPATAHDLAWWSGLTVGDATRAIHAVRGELESVEMEGRLYWRPASTSAAGRVSRAFLLPAWDEYTVAYRDRSHLLAAVHARRAERMGLLSPVVVVNGRVVGRWTRTLGQERVAFTWELFAEFPPAARRSVAAAARHYAAFLGLRPDAS